MSNLNRWILVLIWAEYGVERNYLFDSGSSPIFVSATKYFFGLKWLFCDPRLHICHAITWGWQWWLSEIAFEVVVDLRNYETIHRDGFNYDYDGVSFWHLFFWESAMLPLFQLCIFMQEEGGIFFWIFLYAGGGENILLNIFYAGGKKNIHLKFAQWDVTGYLARPWHGQGQTWNLKWILLDILCIESWIDILNGFEWIFYFKIAQWGVTTNGILSTPLARS